MTTSTHSLLRRDDGQALVEIALVLPVLLVVLFGMLHFGKVFNYWNDATHLTAEAARFAAVNRKPDPANSASLQEQIRGQADADELRNGGTDSVAAPATVCVDFPAGTSNVGDPVRVRMTFSYRWMPFLRLVPGASTITSTTVMRLEAPPTTYSAGCI
jgi:Flp pilus assembly protein TadG